MACLGIAGLWDWGRSPGRVKPFPLANKEGCEQDRPAAPRLRGIYGATRCDR